MNNLQTHQNWMDQAISLAQQAGEAGEIPVGAIIVNHQGKVIGTGGNHKERDQVLLLMLRWWRSVRLRGY